ncbi:unnamed protein product [Echinostoma caproni]|uniref:Anoctamin n=1 Tax=Echinostoma caproni TaxID=27848 RepID=A0A183B9G6_9TREM|nr:unnamed protein product [Echinostoma caproni]
MPISTVGVEGLISGFGPATETNMNKGSGLDEVSPRVTQARVCTKDFSEEHQCSIQGSVDHVCEIGNAFRAGVFSVIVLQFMNSFYSLFYTAFYLRDLEMLQQQLTTVLITRQCIGNLREVFLPYGHSRLRQVLLSFRYERHKQQQDSITPHNETCSTSKPTTIDGDMNPDAEIRQRKDHSDANVSGNESPDEQPIHAPEREATLLPYDGPDEDFLEIFIQFGYISMFSCVFPVAAALALLNNIVEIRADAFKLTHSFQRPFAHPAHSIGVWQVG